MRRADLIPDCGRCAALCCVETSFEASEAFAFDKPAGVRCPHLRPSCRCGIHAELEARGFAGCAAYDCYGAGQRATQLLGQTRTVVRRGDVFRALFALHEWLWLLTEAAKLCQGTALELAEAIRDEVEVLDASAGAQSFEALESTVATERPRVQALVQRLRQALRPRPPRR